MTRTSSDTLDARVPALVSRDAGVRALAGDARARALPARDAGRVLAGDAGARALPARDADRALAGDGEARGPGATDVLGALARWSAVYEVGDAALIVSAGAVGPLGAGLVQPRRRGGDVLPPAPPGPPPTDHLTEQELRDIEDAYAEGITAVQIVELFTSRGIRFSEATFRKYVQQGLLPRSRRIGRKGKNKGSLGMYPAKTVRRIDHVKRLMLEGYTIEEIQAQFLQFTDLVENVGEAIGELLDRLDENLASPRLDAQARRALAKEAAEARRLGDDLVDRLTALAQRALAPRAAELRKSGAADAAEDLL